MGDFWIRICILVIVTTCALGQNYPYNNAGNIFNGCDYFESIELGRVYDVFSPYYPDKYPPGTNCRWSGCAAYGTNIVIKCTDLAIPVYGQCDQNNDRLEVSYQGCQDLVDASRHCTRPFVMETRSNALVMALRTFPNSTGGRFFCQINAQPTALPALQPVPANQWSGPSFPKPNYVPPQPQGPVAVYRPQSSPAYQTGFQPSNPPPQSYPSSQSYSPPQSYPSQQSYSPPQSYPAPQSYAPSESYPQQQPYYSRDPVYRPVAAPQPAQPAQPVPVQPVPARPVYQPSYQPSYQPAYQSAYQPPQPAQPSYQPVQPAYQPVQPAYQPAQTAPSSTPAPAPSYGGYVGGYQGGYQTIYPSQQNFPPYTPTQQVYQPMGPQNQLQCQIPCGQRKRARILGGDSIDIEQMPFACGLTDLNTKRVFCSATIISPNFILTAAHCLYNRTIDQVGIIVGTTDYANPSASRYAATYRMAAVIIHPDYDSLSMLNDIAIVKTGPIEFNPAVGPVCLPISDRLGKQSYDYSPVEAAGWSDTAYTGPQSTSLRSVTLHIITNAQCNDNYPYRITDSQLCFLSPRKDTCTGDDGAGLCHVDTVTGRLVIIGMPSYGVGCGTRQPRVACRISSYIRGLCEQLMKTSALFNFFLLQKKERYIRIDIYLAIVQIKRYIHIKI